MKLIILCFVFPVISYASINGTFYSEFKRDDMDCAIKAQVTQKTQKQITFKSWDELCEDQNGNSFESSLGDIMTYEKIGDKKLKVTQGKDHIELDAKILDFNKDNVHYNFEVDTEDGHLEINESFSLKDSDLSFTSIYTLDGKVIINKSGIIQKQK
jgi:hypothetical protein